VIDVRTQSVQRNTTFAVPLGAGNFRAAKATGELHLDAAGAQTHSVLDRALHGTTEHHTALELAGNVLSDELSVQLGLANFLDVDVNRHAHHLGDVATQTINVFTLLADHDART